MATTTTLGVFVGEPVPPKPPKLGRPDWLPWAGATYRVSTWDCEQGEGTRASADVGGWDEEARGLSAREAVALVHEFERQGYNRDFGILVERED